MPRPPSTTKVPASAVDPVSLERERSRAPVAAPGKHHRQPPPQEHIDVRLGERQGKHAGEKNMKTAWRGGRPS